MNKLPEHVEQSIRERGLFRRGERILVAVSGGVDSMVLLHLLQALAPRHGWKLAVAHFNHQLRGRASDADEQFVKRTAKTPGLKAFTGHGDVKSFAQQHGLSIEMAARDLRHEFLARTAKQLKIRSIALAHHADDQVELFFLRLLRGSGGEGVAGMKWRNPSPADSKIKLARPLLDASKSDLEEFARKNGIRFREDASNVSPDVRRNRIRHELLPLLKRSYQPALARTVLRVMEILGAEAEFAAGAAEKWLDLKHPVPFAHLHIAVQRQCLRLQLMQLNVRADFELIEQLRESPDCPVSVSPILSVFRDTLGLIQIRAHSPADFNEKQIEIALDGKSGEEYFDGVCCRWKVARLKNRKPLPHSGGREFFDADAVGSRIVLRHWRAGDRFQPIGMAAPVKLQDWFTNQKIPRTRRHELLVAESASGKIFWVEEMRISENFKLGSHTRRRLIWHWRRG